MEWSSETHCFIHDEIVTVLSKKPLGLNSAFPNFAALVQTRSPVLWFSSVSAFPSSNLWKKSPPVWDLNARFGDSVLRTLTWTIQSWFEVTDILGPARPDMVKWHQGLLPSDFPTETWGKNRRPKTAKKSGTWGFSIPVLPAVYLIGDPQLTVQFLSAAVLSADSEER